MVSEARTPLSSLLREERSSRKTSRATSGHGSLLRGSMSLVDVFERLDERRNDGIVHDVLSERTKVLAVLKRGPFREPELELGNRRVADGRRRLDTRRGARTGLLQDRCFDPDSRQEHLLL